MEEKNYIVVEESWEYNDEYYSQPDGEPFTLPQPKLYTKEEADKLCEELNLKHGWSDDVWDSDTEQYVDKRINPYKTIKLQA